MIVLLGTAKAGGRSLLDRASRRLAEMGAKLRERQFSTIDFAFRFARDPLETGNFFLS